MQHRNKVGGIIDQRFGENDPDMTPEEKMVERFARERMRSHKKSTLFDLEDDDDGPGEGLTHGGKALTFDNDEMVDDFEEGDLDDGNASDASDREQQRRKRVRAMVSDAAEDDENDEEQPERKKTKKEVMDEIIAKSKLHKFERQQAKDEDEDLRAELDKELPNLRWLLSQGHSKHQENEAHQSSTVAGFDRNAFEKDFDLQVKKLAQDRRAQPSDRTKTEEEKAEDESKRLQELEEKRQRRMRGEHVSDSEADEDEESADGQDTADLDNKDDDDEDDDFGLGRGIKTRPTATELGFDDEDDFVIDDDLVASGSDVDSLVSDEDADDDDDEENMSGAESDEDDEFTRGLLNEEEANNPMFKEDSSAKTSELKAGDANGLPYTFPCPETSEDIAGLAEKYSVENLPTIVQRIRALYHPKLNSKNKDKLAAFSTSLVDFIASPLGTPFDPEVWPSFAVLESLIRHIHSLSKMFPIEIAQQFRSVLEEAGDKRPLALETGDLVLLTAVSTTFPTSDHFHQVVTPAMLTMARYLGQKVPSSLADHAIGVYLSILSLQYQQLSKRHIPEVLNFILNTLSALAPVASEKSGRFPVHRSESSLRVVGAKKATPRRLRFEDCVPTSLKGKKATDVKVAILDTAIAVCDAAADTWAGKEAFQETFDQVQDVLAHLTTEQCRSQLPPQVISRVEKLQAKLERMVRLAALGRRPLELHHHRPLAIKSYVPQFEDTFDPDKHYDPNRERAELAKLKKEHKKERKGAIRELRKDANFMARENLKMKKAKDEAYEKKYKRLVAEIQSEEGREANEYERERKARKRSKNR